MEAEEIFPNPFYQTSIILLPKPDKDITRKLQANISHEHGRKKPQQNINKLNPIMYKKNYILQTSGIYPRYAKLVQHSKVREPRKKVGERNLGTRKEALLDRVLSLEILMK